MQHPIHLWIFYACAPLIRPPAIRMYHHQYRFKILSEMKTFLLFPVFIFTVLSNKDEGEGTPCCHKKIVDGKTYIHAGNAGKSEAMQYKCSNTCVYTLEGDDDKKFCFRPGQQESKCAMTTGGLFAMIRAVLFIRNKPITPKCYK